MLPPLCPPVPPFHPALPRAWLMRLDAVLAVNGVADQPLMHAILLDALPVEFRHLATTSITSPQPYDALCTALLACYALTYLPLPGSRDLSPLRRSARYQPARNHPLTATALPLLRLPLPQIQSHEDPNLHLSTTTR